MSVVYSAANEASISTNSKRGRIREVSDTISTRVKFMSYNYYVEQLNKMKRLLEQRKAGEISLTDEEIYAKIKPKGKRNRRNRRTGVSPLITSLFGGFSECEKLRKEADKAMNEAAEAKKEAISANEQNKVLRL
ncbi:putative pyruvate phosphate dikinase regulatory protein [Bienertia sinuspersici]